MGMAGKLLTHSMWLQYTLVVRAIVRISVSHRQLDMLDGLIPTNRCPRKKLPLSSEGNGIHSDQIMTQSHTTCQ